MKLAAYKLHTNNSKTEKGKRKKEKKYFSIVLVPHSSGKVYKISGLYSKCLFFCAVCAAVLISLTVLTVHTLLENSRLKSDNMVLTSTSSEQNRLLNQKSEEIGQLKEKQTNLSSKINDFTDMYRELAEKYINNKSDGVKTSRAGERNDRTFVRDINELKALLNELDELNGSGSSVSGDMTETENTLKEFMDTVPTLFPTPGKISSGFGERTDPFRFNSRFHTGIDIAAPQGQEIRASAKGTVTLASRTSVYGNTVIIDHGHGITTMYGHASRLLVKKGQKVNKSDVIAKVGSSGRSTGSHLHFEVRINGTPTDPLKYVSNK
ncbi:MAG: peptidoglycan DD-metalloendopeptidase family protein [Clostridiales bacterium]|jgi:murein DD-endopeptidase MepM/ murein hydrolase activator NlpD|nr:peptidoglycan DD-metalloendopeptidase family protein [Eubacteriales bacterium]MDH7566786.1 peptidoglycan DD-metalloendopeptidase family protein [Clostridiales bacterium]